jgi:hypothetical protein
MCSSTSSSKGGPVKQRVALISSRSADDAELPCGATDDRIPDKPVWNSRQSLRSSSSFNPPMTEGTVGGERDC